MTTARLSTRFTQLLRLALLAGAAVGLSGCASHPPHDYPRERVYYEPYGDYYDYLYYPAIGAYYDPRIRIYFYYEHNRWIRTRSLPPHCRPYLDRHVTVRSPRDRPYADHDRHREHYAPERYRKPVDKGHNTRRLDNVWVGVPRPPAKTYERKDSYKDNGYRDGDRTPRAHEREPARIAPPVQQRETERERKTHEESERNRSREPEQWRQQDQDRDHYRERNPATQPQSREYRESTPPPAQARDVTKPAQRVGPVYTASDNPQDQTRDKRRPPSYERDNHKKTPHNDRAHQARTPVQDDDPGALQVE